MFVRVIKFTSGEKANGGDMPDMIREFAYRLMNNGQILPEYTLAANGRDYLLTVTTPKRDSLLERFDSIYVQNCRNKLAAVFDISVTESGENVDCLEYCSCKSRTALEMQAVDTEIDSPLTCLSCGKHVALYELPCIDGQSDRSQITEWQKTYRATDKLWLDGLNDRFFGKQLTDAESALNKLGRQADLKVYYNMFDDLTKKTKFASIDGRNSRICPGCGKAMKHVEFRDGYERFICENCSLSSNIQPCRLDE